LVRLTLSAHPQACQDWHLNPSHNPTRFQLVSPLFLRARGRGLDRGVPQKRHQGRLDWGGPWAVSIVRPSVWPPGAVSEGVSSDGAGNINQAGRFAPGALIQCARINGLELVSERPNATGQPGPPPLYRSGRQKAKNPRARCRPRGPSLARAASRPRADSRPLEHCRPQARCQ
jgi:hypothetical protein